MTADKLQLEPNEIILTQVRKHWFILFANVFGIFLAALLPFIFGVSVLYFAPVSMLAMITLTPAYFIAGYAAWLLLLWMALFNVWTNYYLDIWTVTNVRLIAIDQRGFFNRSMASFRLDRLQDVIVTVDGFIPTLLDFGTLELQTAGEARNFKAHGLPSPSDLKAIILSATDTLVGVAPIQTTKQ
jgi:uncharacterized membrane protein YdbT with pleckstrin-like domain